MNKLVQIVLCIFITTVSVNAQEISPYLFGQNMWLTNGAEGRPGYIDELWPKVESSILAHYGNTPDHFSNSVGFRVIYKKATSKQLTLLKL